jgi:hypothetical protein
MGLRVRHATGKATANGAQGETVVPLFEPLPWPVYRVRIADPPPAWLQRLLTRPEAGPVLLPVGVAHARDFADTRMASRLVVEPVRVYDPVSEADGLVGAALRVRPDDPRAILAFVNEWGVLGVGAGGGTRLAGVESFTLAQDMFRKFRALVGLYKHLEAGRPVSALDERSPEGTVLLPRLESRKERDRERIWAAFSRALYPFLRGIAIGVRWDARGGRRGPSFHVTRLYEVLFLTLWGWATDGTKLRQCRRGRCGSLFVVQRSDQVYCNRGCASHAAVDRFRKNARRRSPRAASSSR